MSADFVLQEVVPARVSSLRSVTVIARLSRRFRVDFEPAHRQPSPLMLLVATVASLAGSLAADALLVVIGTRMFPSVQHFGHFQFSDYGKLTVIGVLIACAAWPVVTRISSAPRWLFVRLAVAVTLVLWLPDLYILKLGEPPRGVVVLMLMHLAIALVTYNCLVHIAKVRPTAVHGGHRAPSLPGTRHRQGAGDHRAVLGDQAADDSRR
jgi:hypothetical protein